MTSAVAEGGSLVSRDIYFLKSTFDLVSLIATYGNALSDWIIDSGASLHVSSHGEWLTSYVSTKDHVWLGNEQLCDILGVGDVQLKFHNGSSFMLKNINMWKVSKGSMTKAHGVKSGGLNMIQVLSVSKNVIHITEDLGFDAFHGSITDQCSTSELKDVLDYVPIDAGTIGTLFDLDTQEVPACSDIEAHVAPHDKTKDLVLDAFSYAMAQQLLSEDKALNSGPVDSSIMLDTSIDCTTGITNLHETCKSTQLLTLVNLPLAQINQGECSHLRKPEGEALMNFDTTNTFGIENTICLPQTSVQPLKQSSTQSTIEDNQNLKSKRKKMKSQESSFDHIIYVPTPCSSAFEFEPADTSRIHNNGGSDSSSATYATSRSYDLPILNAATHNPKLVVESQISALSCNALDEAQIAASAPDEKVMAHFEDAVDADNTEKSDAAEINGIGKELYFDTMDGLVEESSNSTQENGERLEIKTKKKKKSKEKNSKTEDIISTSSDSTEKSSAAEVNGIEKELYFDATENSSKITHENKNNKKKKKSKMKNNKNEDMTSTNAASAEVSRVGIRENLLSIINASHFKDLHKWVYLGTY
ncbi:hypothetical protein L7F22_049088 [Adiantum nelumboides]|nr:hypothetical protein [Adiantum nelumboides]